MTRGVGTVVAAIGLLGSGGCGDDAESSTSGAGTGGAQTGGKGGTGAGFATGGGGSGGSSGVGNAGSGGAGAIGGGGSGGSAASTGGGVTGGSGGASGSGGSSGSSGSGGAGGGCSASGTPVQRHGQLRVQGTQLVDACGNPVQLKGASSMWLNWDDADYALDRQGLQFARDNWGMKVFRAAMGVDPGNNQGGYLEEPEVNKAKVRTIVDNAIALGLYVIIDWHDHAAEDHRSQAVAFFTEMAQQYGNQPNVLYEVYNEPLDVDWGDVLKPYHEALLAAIRQVDPDNVVILGTPTWSQAVDEAAMAPVGGSNLMYTLHFYSCTHTDWLRTRADDALQQGLPIFVTEWGATDADGGTDGLLCLQEAELWHQWMNANGISWTAWKYDGCEDSTCYFVDRDVSTGGGWTSGDLNGHAPFVIEKMRQ